MGMLPELPITLNGEKRKSTCCYCGVGCGVLLSIERNGTLKVEGDSDHPVNAGMLCSKGINLHYTVNDRQDRLLYPQVRYSKQQQLHRSTWDEALERVAKAFTAIIARYGPDSVAFYASGQCLTEEYYVLNKLMKGFIGSNNIDTNSRLCMSSAVSSYKMALGEDIVPVSYADIELADCIYVTGANPAWCHPILWRRVEAAKLANPHLIIIVADPRKTASCDSADYHLQITPGTDITLNHAIGRILIEKGYTDHEFIGSHTEGFDAYKQLVFNKSIEESAAICGLEAAQIVETASIIGKSATFISMWAMGLNQSTMAVDKNLSLINLHLITGQISKPGSGPLSLTGQPNAMGGRETGGLANLLPAHRDLSNATHREEVQQLWGSKPISGKPGFTATEIFEALADDRLKAIYIIGTNPLVSMPNVKLVEAALKKARFVVVQDISMNSASLAYADVILPAAAWAEKSGTMTNSERRISLLENAVLPPGDALPDADIICRLAAKMGYHGFNFTDAGEIYAEHVKLTAGTQLDITGLSHAILKQNGSVQWPVSQQNKLATGFKTSIRPFKDQIFSTLTGKALIHAVPDINRSEKADDEFPFVLTTGRIRDQWHTMTKTGKVNKLKSHLPDSFIEIHSADAKNSGITENDLVLVQSRRGQVRLKARITDTIRMGLVFLPMHWGKILGSDLNRANNLTSDKIDPVSKEPDFKYCAVNIQKYKKEKQKIVIIGAGAASFAFIKKYRELNAIDEISVFSKEQDIFYNRVMLPDYISGEQNWDNLQKLEADDENELNMRVHRGVSINTIDRERKQVTDSAGRRFQYDLLILATGSRANRPREIPSLPGIFTMRTRLDAELFRKQLAPEAHVAIVGGGLLGLEMGASLRSMGIRVTLIHRVSRFMIRQLDSTASQMLYEEMIDQGCDVFFDDEVQVYYGRNQLTGLGLRSGRRINCDALIVAVGTTPNIELARAAGISSKRGITVNARMQTDDPAVFAIGEVAEFEGNLYGTTAAAEEQAIIAASFISGDISPVYTGSTLMNIIKIHGFDLCSLGLSECLNEPGYEEVLFIDKAKRSYKKCIIYGDRLVGAILIGDKTEFNEFRKLISEKIELSERRLNLLRSGVKTAPVTGRIICSCNQVGEGNISQLINTQQADLNLICSITGAGTGCGSCKPEIARMIKTASCQLIGEKGDNYD